MRKGICRECKCETESTRKPKIFCSAACRDAHTNRRKERGAQLYDLFMAVRYDRANAKRLNAWTKLCRMAEAFHDEDLEAGITSTLDLETVLEKRAYLGAQKVVKKSRRHGAGAATKGA